MLDPYQLTVHSLTLRQFATADQLADVIGRPESEVETQLQKAVTDGLVLAARGKFMISPAGREYLDGIYPTAFAGLRSAPPVVDALTAFEEGVNKQVLSLTTAWQTKDVGGERVPNDHGDPDHDAAILDKLGQVHERTQKVLRPVADADPLIDRFLDRIGAALDRAERGETDYVSGVRVDSMHTVWFQLHEHLLRLSGRERPA